MSLILIALARYEVTKIGTTINGVQKEIGMKKKVGLTAAARCGWRGSPGDQ